MLLIYLVCSPSQQISLFLFVHVVVVVVVVVENRNHNKFLCRSFNVFECFNVFKTNSCWNYMGTSWQLSSYCNNLAISTRHIEFSRFEYPHNNNSSRLPEIVSSTFFCWTICSVVQYFCSSLIITIIVFILTNYLLHFSYESNNKMFLNFYHYYRLFTFPYCVPFSSVFNRS